MATWPERYKRIKGMNSSLYVRVKCFPLTADPDHGIELYSIVIRYGLVVHCISSVSINSYYVQFTLYNRQKCKDSFLLSLKNDFLLWLCAALANFEDARRPRYPKNTGEGCEKTYI
mgnify:CR=1 FL=1